MKTKPNGCKAVVKQQQQQQQKDKTLPQRRNGGVGGEEVFATTSLADIYILLVLFACTSSTFLELSQEITFFCQNMLSALQLLLDLSRRWSVGDTEVLQRLQLCLQLRTFAITRVENLAKMFDHPCGVGRGSGPSGTCRRVCRLCSVAAVRCGGGSGGDTFVSCRGDAPRTGLTTSYLTQV